MRNPLTYLLLKLAIWTGRKGWRKTQRQLVRVKLFLQGYYPHTRMKILLGINAIAFVLNSIVLVVNPNPSTVVCLAMLLISFVWCMRLLKSELELKKEIEELKNSFPFPINNKGCKYYCEAGVGSLAGVCAVNPSGPCQGCKDYEPNPQGIKK